MSVNFNTGRVITRFGAELLVENNTSNNSKPVRCTARRKFDSIVCGDYVSWHPNPSGNASVVDQLPRKNALSRPGYRGKSRTIAANIDQLVIVNSWLPEPSWDLVDRYLVAAKQLGANSVIVMNKHDLAEEQAIDADWEALQNYIDLGYPVIHINALEGKGINELIALMQDKTSILSGRSGVGKSSIANQILPDSDILVGIISDSGEGKHTTSTATLYELDNGGFLIDSPGVRDYALGDISAVELAAGYIEFAQYRDSCRFHNCQHDHEPGCAVHAAVAEKQINEQRYSRYINALHALA